MLIESAGIYNLPFLSSQPSKYIPCRIAWHDALLETKSHKSKMDMSEEKTDHADRIGHQLQGIEYEITCSIKDQ